MAAPEDTLLSFWDYFVFGLSLAVSLVVGFYYYFSGGRQRTNQEYLLADSSMNVWVVSVSLMASFMSAITLLGVPAEVYSFGAIFFYINLSYGIGTPFCVYFFLPVFYNLKCTSAYEYLELRFSSRVRTLASATFMVQMIFYMGIVLYAPALALSAVTGLSKWSSIISVGLVCTLYCGFGGIKAVLWTDFLQSGLMFLALIAVAVIGIIEVGGVSEVYQLAVEGGRMNFNNFDLDPTVRHSFWTLAIGGVFIYCSLFGVNQTQVQRLLNCKSLKQAQFAALMAWPITSFLSLCCVITGIVMYAYFKDCDPILSKEAVVSRPDQLLPLFMLKIMGSMPGLPGLFIAGVFSGALSSVSSFVNSLAAVTLEDFVKPIIQSRSLTLTGEKEAWITKVIAILFGFVCLLLTVVAEQMTGILEASLTIFGVVGGPLLGLFTLGMMSKRCSSKSAIIAFLISLSVGFWIGFGSVNFGVAPTALPKSISQCQDKFNWTRSAYPEDRFTYSSSPRVLSPSRSELSSSSSSSVSSSISSSLFSPSPPSTGSGERRRRSLSSSSSSLPFSFLSNEASSADADADVSVITARSSLSSPSLSFSSLLSSSSSSSSPETSLSRSKRRRRRGEVEDEHMNVVSSSSSGSSYTNGIEHPLQVSSSSSSSSQYSTATATSATTTSNSLEKSQHLRLFAASSRPGTPSSSAAATSSQEWNEGEIVLLEEEGDESPSSHSAGDGVFYLYKLSYMYLAGLTFLIEVSLGVILSSSCLFPNDKLLNCNLISPMFSCGRGRRTQQSSSTSLTMREAMMTTATTTVTAEKSCSGEEEKKKLHFTSNGISCHREMKSGGEDHDDEEGTRRGTSQDQGHRHDVHHLRDHQDDADDDEEAGRTGRNDVAADAGTPRVLSFKEKKKKSSCPDDEVELNDVVVGGRV